MVAFIYVVWSGLSLLLKSKKPRLERCDWSRDNPTVGDKGGLSDVRRESYSFTLSRFARCFCPLSQFPRNNQHKKARHIRKRCPPHRVSRITHHAPRLPDRTHRRAAS